MKPALTKQIMVGIYHYDGIRRVEGKHVRLRGDVTGLTGDVSGLRGDIDSCEITQEERAKGLDIATLVVKEG